MSMWKRIADEMPPDRTPVLCFGVNRYDPEQNMSVVIHYPRSNYLHQCAASGQEAEFDIEVTHWMPLPLPPDQSTGDT